MAELGEGEDDGLSIMRDGRTNWVSTKIKNTKLRNSRDEERKES